MGEWKGDQPRAEDPSAWGYGYDRTPGVLTVVPHVVVRSPRPRYVQEAMPEASDLPAWQRWLFHELSGPCLFRPVPIDRSCLAWNGGAVRKMAQRIYDDRRFADLPVLADALEDADCGDAAILAHCRGPGEHVRGCWVVDLLTGRQ
jgi:hypothetical protein